MREKRATGLVKCEIPQIRFSEEIVSKFWSNLEGLYSWVPEYYRHMVSCPSTAIVVKSANSGVKPKWGIRARHRSLSVIYKLQTKLGLNFQPDLIHGSDPGQIDKEIAIVCFSPQKL